MSARLHADMRFSSDPIESVLFKKQIDGFFSQTLGRTFQIKGQHTKLLPCLRRQIDRQDTFALTAWRSSAHLRGWLLGRGDLRENFGLFRANGSLCELPWGQKGKAVSS